MVIYLVQSTSDLIGSAGYCRGLIEAEHERVLVTFADLGAKHNILPPQKGPLPAPQPPCESS